MKLSSQPELRRRSPTEFPFPLETLSEQLEQYYTGISAERERGRAQCLAARSLRCRFAPCPMICCQTWTIYDRQRALFHPPLVDAKSATPRPPLLLLLPLEKRLRKEQKNDINISKGTIDRRYTDTVPQRKKMTHAFASFPPSLLCLAVECS